MPRTLYRVSLIFGLLLATPAVAEGDILDRVPPGSALGGGPDSIVLPGAAPVEPDLARPQVVKRQHPGVKGSKRAVSAEPAAVESPRRAAKVKKSVALKAGRKAKLSSKSSKIKKKSKRQATAARVKKKRRAG